MNKIECINKMVTMLREAWEKYGGPKDYMKRREIYAECRKFCKDNGYTGNCFAGMYEEAVKKANRE